MTWLELPDDHLHEPERQVHQEPDAEDRPQLPRS